jgi:hypothetical protein
MLESIAVPIFAGNTFVSYIQIAAPGSASVLLLYPVQYSSYLSMCVAKPCKFAVCMFSEAVAAKGP